MTSTDHDPRDDQLMLAQLSAKIDELQAPIPSALAEPTLAVDLQMAEMDRLIATAHKYPRDLKTFVAQLDWMACNNEAAADNCVYALPRAGKAIVGASIGFANLAATCWGNIWDMGRWIYTDRKEGIVIAEGVCIDWQTNRRVAMTEQRRILDKGRRLFSDDMIIVTSKAAAAIARRNAILQLIPRPLWFPTYEKALYMVRGSEATLVERRHKAVAALANFGVDPKRVFMYLGVGKLEEIGVEHMPTLRGMFAQLRDGSVTVEEMFDPRKASGTGFEHVSNPLADEDGVVVEPAKEAVVSNGSGQPATVNGQTLKPGEAVTVQAAAPEAQGEPEQAPPGADQGGEKNEPAAVSGPAPAPEAGGKKNGGKKKAAKADEAAPMPSEPAPPKTAEEYLAYSTGPAGWVTTATNASALDNRRKSPAERELRKICGVMEDDLISFNAAFETKLAALKGSAS